MPELDLLLDTTPIHTESVRCAVAAIKVSVQVHTTRGRRRRVPEAAFEKYAAFFFFKNSHNCVNQGR